VRRVFTLPGGLSLSLLEPEPASAGAGRPYPTSSLQRGLLLFDEGQELSGEGVGFGVPVLKRGPRAVFAGGAEVAWDERGAGTVTVTYLLDRVERLGGRHRASPLLVPLDWAREAFALLYRRAPLLRRGLLAGSNGVRRLLRVRTRFEPVELVARVPVTYSLGARDGELCVSVDLAGLPPAVTEVVIMNELGAPFFDVYAEEDGRLERGSRIGAWNRVREASASFRSSAGDVWFGLDRDPDPAAPDARLFHGREMATGRLAWAGFGYCFRPGPETFSYRVRVGRSEEPGEAAADGREAAARGDRMAPRVDVRGET
jgi:hypothetical protein